MSQMDADVSSGWRACGCRGRELRMSQITQKFGCAEEAKYRPQKSEVRSVSDSIIRGICDICG